MAVTRNTAGSVIAVNSSTASPTIPTNLVGDILLLFLATASTPSGDPAGWTLIGSETAVSGAKLYVWWTAVSGSPMTGTVSVNLVGSSVNRAMVISYTGANTTVSPTFAVNTGTGTATTTTSMTFSSGFAVDVNGRSAASTLSAHVSGDATWTATEEGENSGTNALTVTDGPLTAGNTTTLQATSSASVSWNSIALSIATPGTGYTGAAGLSGAGSLSAVGALGQTVALGGTGTLAVPTNTPQTVATVGLPGAGALTATSVPSLTATAALPGHGVLTTVGGPSAKAALPGHGVLSTVVVPKAILAIPLAGAGFLTVQTLVGTAPLAQDGQTTLEFRVTKYATAVTTPLVYDEVLNGHLSGSWTDEMLGPGAGTVVLPTTHPKLVADPSLMAQRNWITVLASGRVVGRFILQTKELVLANQGSSGDLADRLWTLSGEGLRTLFHDAVVFPENGHVGSTTQATRFFNFSDVTKSKWYISSDWKTPHVGPKFLEKNSYFGKEPAGYPTPNGYWIWGSTPNSTTGYAAVGYNYFRGEFTTSVSDPTQTYSFYAAGDDAMILYLDGAVIAQTNVGVLSFANVTAVEGVALDPGSHVLAAAVYNAQGRAGFMACVRKDANDNLSTPISTITYTGDTGHWTVRAYPSQEPGWTIGEVMLKLWGEAKTRGVNFPNQLTPTFTDTVDSAGIAWPTTGQYSFSMNTEYIDVLSTLETMGCEAWIDPVTLNFNLYVSKGVDYSNVTSYPNPPTIQIGQNITTADEVSIAAIKNGLLVQTADGWVYQTDSNSLAAFGRIEGGTQVQVTTKQSSAIINKTFKLLSTPQVSTTYQILDKAALVPGIAFLLGDWIMAPAMNVSPTTLAKRRVMSITWATDDSTNNMNVVYSVELDTVYQDNITMLTNLIARLNNSDAITGAATTNAIGGSTGAGNPSTNGGGPGTSNQTMAPPTSFAVGNITGTYDTSGNPTCALALSWVAPVDAEGNTGQVGQYEVYGSTSTIPWGLLSRIDGTLTTFTLDVTPVMDWTLGIRAHPDNNISLYSDFSNLVTVTSVKPSVALDKPTAPTLTSDLGTITIHWDGNLTNGTPYTPPVQFQYVSAYMYTVSPSQSDIHQVSGLLVNGGALVVTGLTVGTTYYVVLYANDTAGLTSAQSAPSSITCVGISQVNTDAAFQATISSINSAATSAQTTANTALTAANGKNVVHFSTGTPGTTAGIVGDQWFQQDVSGNVTGQFICTGGTTWLAQALTNSVISTLDAGKITTGTLSSSRIAAGTIVTPQLAIADFTNLFPSPQMTTAQGGSNFPSTGVGPTTAQYAYTTNDVPNGSAWVMDDRDNISTFFFPAKAGDSFYIEYTAKQVKGAASPMVGAVWIEKSNGLSGSTEAIPWNSYDVLSHVLSSGTVANVTLSNSWVRYYSRVQIPSNFNNVAKAALYFQIPGQSAGAYTFGWAVSDVIIRRMGTGTLMVDGSITATSIAAQTITANNMAAGSISADKLDLGTIPTGTSFNRVPNPMSNQTYWNMIISASNPLSLGGSVGATAGTTGVALLPTTSVDAYIYVALKAPVPQSGSIYITMASSQNKAYPVVTEYTSSGSSSDFVQVSSTIGVTYSFSSTAVNYSVRIHDLHVASPVSDNVTFVSVFEVIGANAPAGSSAELSPDGLKLFTGENQNAVLSLSATSDDILTLSSSGGDQVATIDAAGNGSFNTVSGGDGSTFDGVQLSLNSNDSDYAFTLPQSSPNGNGWTRGDETNGDGSQGVVALLDRLARGVIYDVTWPSRDGTSIAIGTQYQRIAQDNFTLEDGRSYMFNVQTGALQATNSSNVNMYLEFQIGLVPNTSIQSGQTITRGVLYHSPQMAGNWVLPPVIWAASDNQATIDVANRSLPANVPIYWQVNFNMSAALTSAVLLNEFGWSRGVTVVDLGSVYPTRPVNGADGLASTADNTTSGASSGSTSGGTTASSTTKTFTAQWSASYNHSGSTKVTGGGTQWTNANAMYQGNGVTPMGAQWGFSSTDLANIHGKTITSAQIYMKNAYMAYSGSGVARIGTHNASAATSTIGNAYGGNEFGVTWSSGSSKWLSLSSTIRTGLSANTIKGFQIGIDGSNTDYMYFEGVGYGSHPPQLKVTYH